jgi:hypothetical protein
MKLLVIGSVLVDEILLFIIPLFERTQCPFYIENVISVLQNTEKREKLQSKDN